MHFPHEQYANIGRLFPEVVLCAFGILIMAIDPFVGAARQRILGWLGFVGALAGLAAVYVPAHHLGMAYSDLISADEFSVFVHLAVISASATRKASSAENTTRSFCSPRRAWASSRERTSL
jgi:NADH:ubiquinone oxidoreductase subunit 2 (subunit N)